MGGWGKSEVRVGGALAVGVAVLVGMPAAATADASPVGFAGHCSLQGTTRFSPAITPRPGPAMLTTSAAGSCSGTLDGRVVTSEAVAMDWRAPVDATGCLAAHTTAMGPGALRFGDDTVVAFTAGFSGAVTEYVLTIRGQQSGSASGLANLATTRTDPLAVTTACAGLGGGLAQTPVDVTIATTSPLVDGSDAPGPAFSGLCQISGGVHFLPPLRTSPQQGRVDVTASGTCSGELAEPDGTRRSLSGAPAYLTGGSSGTESCEAGTGSGVATLIVAGRPLSLAYDELRLGPALVLTARGAGGGSSLAEGNVSPTADPVAVVGACTTSGLASAPIDVRVLAGGLG